MQPAGEIYELEWWRPPVFMLSFAVLEAFIFVYQRIACGPVTFPPTCIFDRTFILLFAHPFQFWRWITYVFVHDR